MLKKVCNMCKKHRDWLPTIVLLVIVCALAQIHGQAWWMPLAVIGTLVLIFCLIITVVSILFSRGSDDN